MKYQFETDEPIVNCNDCPCYDFDARGCQVLKVLFVNGWGPEFFPRPKYCPLLEVKNTVFPRQDGHGC